VLSVLHVIARMPPSGTELQLAGMLRAAAAQGLWQPTLCVLYPGFELTAQLAAEGIAVIELDDSDRPCAGSCGRVAGTSCTPRSGVAAPSRALPPWGRATSPS
jgi:hypothetical protein